MASLFLPVTFLPLSSSSILLGSLERLERLYYVFLHLPSYFPNHLKESETKNPKCSLSCPCSNTAKPKLELHGGACWVTKAQLCGPDVQLVVAVMHPHWLLCKQIMAFNIKVAQPCVYSPMLKKKRRNRQQILYWWPVIDTETLTSSEHVI